MQQIAIRTIQHYLYCPHRWGLLEIDDAWAENAFVVKANFLHSRVHSNDIYQSRGKTVLTDVSIWNDTYGIYGKLDCLEKSEKGYCIVEYKPTMPKEGLFNYDDAMQVFAQKKCVDSIFHCNSKAVIYYSDVKKRIELPFDERYEEFDQLLQKILLDMRQYLQAGTIPLIQKGQKCSGCSMENLCMPSALKRSRKKLADRIHESIEEDM